jgi:hypothetical protein
VKRAKRAPVSQSCDRKRASDLPERPRSALAEDYPGTDAVTRELLYGLDHMQLMWDQAVYERLAKWLGV